MIYVIQTETGKETHICAVLKREKISAYVPRRSLIIHKRAGWTKIINVMFPGYVFLDIDYLPELYHTVKNIEGVIRFLGEPSPIFQEEEAFMRLLFNGGEMISVSSATVDKDGNITVTDGWLKGKEKYVTYWNIRQKKASVTVTFGGKRRRANVGVTYTKL